MRVGVTGADGFTGRYLAMALAARGAEMVPLSANLTDRQAVRAEIEAKPFDRLIHLAALAFVGTEDWQPFYAVNQIGSFHLLDAVAAIRPGTRCILASSAQIYGPQASGLVHEDMPANPANDYALSKYAMELGAHQHGRGLEIVIARPFNYTGVGQEARYLIPKIVEHVRRRAPVIELGNLDVRRDFGDVRAVAAAYAGLALSEQTLPPVVNIASGVVHGLRDILAMVQELTAHFMEVRVNPAFVRANEVPVLGGDASRLKAALRDWAPVPIEHTLQWMLEANA
jgi:GDP-6-deoxy-D-talose 4-dehydrogenase